jgi:hypothetical protein
LSKLEAKRKYCKKQDDDDNYTKPESWFSGDVAGYANQCSARDIQDKDISKAIGISVSAIRHRIKKYNLAVKFPKKNDWKQIVKRVRDIDPFYQSNGLYPLELRQTYYRLVTLDLKKGGSNQQNKVCYASDRVVAKGASIAIN